MDLVGMFVNDGGCLMVGDCSGFLLEILEVVWGWFGSVVFFGLLVWFGFVWGEDVGDEVFGLVFVCWCMVLSLGEEEGLDGK